jgi:hypothetical protein
MDPGKAPELPQALPLGGMTDELFVTTGEVSDGGITGPGPGRG